jgi:hypothetical protein
MTTDLSSLLAAAARRIQDTGRQLQPEERDAATALLTDLYAAGLRHGIRPQDWSAVGSLGDDCIDAIKQRTLHQQQAQRRQRLEMTGQRPTGLGRDAEHRPSRGGRGL